jgi:hypothetical protein
MTDTLNKNTESCTGYRTPETDEAKFWSDYHGHYVVFADRASDFEHERDSCLKQYDDLLLLLGKTQDRMFDAEHYLDEAIKMLEEYHMNVSDDELETIVCSNKFGSISKQAAKREIRRREIINTVC